MPFLAYFGPFFVQFLYIFCPFLIQFWTVLIWCFGFWTFLVTILFLFYREKVCCGVIFRGPHGEVAIDPRFLNPCNACKDLKEPLTPLSSSERDRQIETESDDASSVSSNSAESTLGSLAAAASSKMEVEEVDDEGFFDKPAVSPSTESGTSTPPPSLAEPLPFSRLVVPNCATSPP